MGRLAAPQTRIVDYKRVKRNLHSTILAVNTYGSCIFIHHVPIGIAYDGAHRHLISSCMCSNLSLNLYHTIVGRSDIERMTHKVGHGIGCHECHIAKESATSIPARVQGLSRMGTHSNDILSIEVQLTGDIHLKSYVTIVGTAYTLTIEIHITHIHDTLEIK